MRSFGYRGFQAVEMCRVSASVVDMTAYSKLGADAVLESALGFCRFAKLPIFHLCIGRLISREFAIDQGRSTSADVTADLISRIGVSGLLINRNARRSGEPWAVRHRVMRGTRPPTRERLTNSTAR